MAKYWFRQKRFGYGLEPCSWQGGVAIVILIGLIMLIAYANGLFNEKTEPSVKRLVLFFVEVAILIVLFMVRLKDKTEGGKLRWNWGKRKEEKDDENQNLGY